MLSMLLHNYYNKPVILLIDEYDVPLQTAYVKGYYDEAKDFLKDFYITTFKDNSYLEKTILTGVSREAKESIFSGANNFDVYTVLEDEFSDDFGITTEEMKKVIKDFEIEEDEPIEETIKNAKKQIKEKGYEKNLKERGFTNITKMVFAFNGKEVKIEIFK